MTERPTWKDLLNPRIEAGLGREIDVFETQIHLKKQGRIDDKLFAETRLRRGAYGQRYDNGQRYDGVAERHIAYPNSELTKGPMTLWDAPGMMRIKLPLGVVTPEQLETMCELAEEYSDDILHVTTRQDIQLHFVHIDDTPDLMRRLAAVGITTREACGNSVRNVTQCPYSGTCKGEAFDTTPHAYALTYFLLGHDDTQNFGRKFKVAFSGCKSDPCGLVNFHDLGAVARTKVVDGVLTRGFEIYVGGGLGSVPQEARLLSEFTPEAELLPFAQAIARVFARLGEKENRSRARLKFLIKKLGMEEFSRLVAEERTKLRPDPRWTEFLSRLDERTEQPQRPAAAGPVAGAPRASDAFLRDNVKSQKQSGYFTVKVKLPLGDFTSDQGRVIAELARRFSGNAMRLTADQNLLFRWVSGAEIGALQAELAKIGLAEAGADTITDITSCPGTDTCKLGISSSRGLSRELLKQFSALEPTLSDSARGLHIKCSGCFNSCGQHHVADIGFLGVSRNVGGRRVPHFQLVVGGTWTDNAGAYGLAIGAIPSKNVPQLAKKLVGRYEAERVDGENFRQFVERIGKKEIRKIVDEFSSVPSHTEDPSYYSDWGDPREYTIGDMGVGECAGEVVSSVEMGLSEAEREVFEAQLLLEQKDAKSAAERGFLGMLTAARTLAKEIDPNLGKEPTEIVPSFKTHFYDTKFFFDPFVGPKFAQYFFKAAEDPNRGQSLENAHQLIEEASLFVEAAHACHQRMLAARAGQTT
jgi:sulfite reductase (ferredoxin)